MADYEYYLGDGNVHTFGADAPTKRADGTPLAREDIATFEMHVDNPDGTSEVIEDVDLIDDLGTPQYDGSFSKPVAVDALAAGVYTYGFKTIDKGGRKSILSDTKTIEVLAPLAIPNPPTNIISV